MSVPTFLQKNSTNGAVTSAAAFSLAFLSNITAGSLLIAACETYPSAQTLTGVTDDQGNTWVLLSGLTSTGGGNWLDSFAYCLNAKAGATTVTFTFSGATNYCTPVIAEYSNVSALRTNGAGATGGNTTAVTTDSITPTVGDLLLAVVYTGASGGSLTWGGSYTQRGEGDRGSFYDVTAIADVIATSGAAQTETATLAGAAGYDWGARLIAFTPGVGTCVQPTFQPPAGTYGAGQLVELSTITPGASIYYTTDGSTPTTGSTLYSGAVSVAASKTLKAIAHLAGNTDSSVGSAAYTITGAAAPALIQGQNYQGAFTAGTTGALAFGAGTTAGSLLVAICQIYRVGLPNLTVTDDKSQTWTVISTRRRRR